MLITINTEEIAKLVEKSGEVFLSNEGEEHLVNLLTAHKQLTDAIVEAKEKIAEEAAKISPNFKSITSDRLKISYRTYGAKFKLDESFADQVPKELIQKRVSYSINATAVEKYAEEHDLPVGIIENDRKPQLSVSLKKEDENA